MDAYRVDYQDNRILNVNNIGKNWGKKTHLDKEIIEVDRYHAGYVISYIDWLYTDWENKVTPGIKRGKHVNDKKAKAQVLYHKFKKRTFGI